MSSPHPPLLLATGSTIPVPGAAARDGVFRLDGGAEPVFLGVRGQGGILHSVVVDNEDSDRWYAGARGGGVWRTDDAGGDWHECAGGLTYREVWCLVQHPVSGQLLAGTGPAALFTSADRGGSWRPVPSLLALADRRDWEFRGPPFHAHIKDIGLSAGDPELIFGAVEEGGVIRSRDGGGSWVNIHDGVEFDCHSVTVFDEAASCSSPRAPVSTAATMAETGSGPRTTSSRTAT